MKETQDMLLSLEGCRMCWGWETENNITTTWHIASALWRWLLMCRMEDICRCVSEDSAQLCPVSPAAHCSIAIQQITTEILCFICLKRYTLIQLLVSVWIEYLLLCRHTWWKWRVPTPPGPGETTGPASYKTTKEKRKAPVSLTLLHFNSEKTLKRGSLDQEFEQGIKSTKKKKGGGFHKNKCLYITFF